MNGLRGISWIRASDTLRCMCLVIRSRALGNWTEPSSTVIMHCLPRSPGQSTTSLLNQISMIRFPRVVATITITSEWVLIYSVCMRFNHTLDIRLCFRGKAWTSRRDERWGMYAISISDHGVQETSCRNQAAKPIYASASNGITAGGRSCSTTRMVS
jgi:hypothetical protein